MSATSIANPPQQAPANHLAPAAARVSLPSPAWTHSIALRLYFVAVFLIPVQLEIDSFRSIVGSRFPPGDIFLAFSLLLAPASFRIIRRPIGYLPFALPLVLGYGAIISLILEGYLTPHSMSIKFLGSVVLVVTGVVTLAYAQAGYTGRILRTFLWGVAFWGGVGYVDWRIVDILPWLETDVSSRFGALQYDQNNAGAMFAVAVLISWRYGHRLFARRWVWVGLTVWYGTALALTLSRGAYVATAAAIITVLIVDHVSAERMMRYLAGAFIIASFTVATGFVDTAIGDFERRPDTVTSRGGFVETGVDRWVDSRGLGMGLGVFLEENTSLIHNTAIWLVVEMSLPGLLFYLAMMFIPFHACLRLRTYDHELALALLAAHTAMIVASVGIEALYQRSWWLIIGLTVMPLAAVRAEQNAAATGAPRQRRRLLRS